MKKIIFLISLALCISLFAVSGIFMPVGLSVENPEKTDALYHDSVIPVDYDTYTPINYDRQYSMWFTAMDYNDILLNKSEEEFKENIYKCFENARSIGINTVYVHVRSNGDAYYNSELFPHGQYFSENSDFDPLEIMIDTAHSMGLSFHAWINPMRIQTTKQMDNMSSEYRIKQWYDDNEKNGIYIVCSEDMWYLNPAYSEVRSFIADGVMEIVENYKVDGIHIDDYFYPTTKEFFDDTAFAQSGNDNLAQWRLDNASFMVREIYDVINSVNNEILFGISPQGNIDADYSSQYADVKKWCSEKGYCDYIVPQIYYGFENSLCPFAATLEEWCDMADEPKLIVGICTYKNGKEDKWAGKGKNEWIENDDITERQLEYAINNSMVDGIAIYSYSSTFENEKTAEEIRKILVD